MARSLCFLQSKEALVIVCTTHLLRFTLRLLHKSLKYAFPHCEETNLRPKKNPSAQVDLGVTQGKHKLSDDLFILIMTIG